VFAALPDIVLNGLVTLSDPKAAFMSQNIATIARAGKLSASAIAACNAVTANLTTVVGASLLNKLGAAHDPERVATSWLASIGLSAT
jgi:osmoprotectant transport system substrate-binding protein